MAEGIEDDGQLARLRDLGCELGQGYLFARPQDGPTFSATFLAEYRRTHEADKLSTDAEPRLGRARELAEAPRRIVAPSATTRSGG